MKMFGAEMAGSECAFVKPLLEWWGKTSSGRNYPWRDENDPYKVLIAEILLQRTRRDKVVEVYEKFVKKFPTPGSLANASVEDVEKVIYGLGLRKRAPYLVKLAKELVKNYDGIVKTGRFEKLPGVGRYVASAARLILGYDTELVPDSSIARVFSRLFGKSLNRRRPADTSWVRRILNECAPRDLVEKREYFLALIDLAWEICRSRKPFCDKCPFVDKCMYHKRQPG